MLLCLLVLLLNALLVMNDIVVLKNKDIILS